MGKCLVKYNVLIHEGVDGVICILAACLWYLPNDLTPRAKYPCGEQRDMATYLGKRGCQYWRLTQMIVCGHDWRRGARDDCVRGGGDKGCTRINKRMAVRPGTID